MTQIQYLGHAGFVVEHSGTRLLIDPWFYPAFLASWFPHPDNRFLLENVISERFDYLYVSHLHEDHFDHRLLDMLNKNITVLCPIYRSRGVEKRFRKLGFTRIHTLAHKQSISLAENFQATMYLDTGHKEDSALLLDLDGFRFFDMNDCNTPMSELPPNVDLLAAQYSGAMWYPNCYDYPPTLMQDKVALVRQDLLDTLVQKCQKTGAAAYLPSAGPACFLDPTLWQFNDRDATIFPVWENVQDSFRAACPEIRTVEPLPGDALQIRDRSLAVEPFARERPECDLADYSERRRDEWEAFHALPECSIQDEEIASYFATLQRRNRHLLQDFAKTVRLAADQKVWMVQLGELAENYVIEAEEPFDPEYSLLMSGKILRQILDGVIGWEEALLSLRVQLRRNPDVFDSRLFGLLRYGHEPAQTLKMTREMANTEMMERGDLRMQRFCPHAGEDLAFAMICNGEIECPRHHWKWNAETGECLKGGNLRLRVESIAVAVESIADSVSNEPVLEPVAK